MSFQKISLIMILLILSLPGSLIAQNPFFKSSNSDNEKVEIDSTAISNDESQISLITELKMKLLNIQKRFYKKLYNQKDQIKTGRGIFLAIFIAFIYGFFHALGPGHGKIFLSGYFFNNKANIKKGLVSSFSVGMLHSLSGVILVFLLYYIFNAPVTSTSDNIRNKMQLVSYFILLALGLFLLFKSMRSFSRKDFTENNTLSLGGLIIAVGLVPCPGAVIISIFSISVLNSIIFAVILNLSMGIGMSLAISFFSLLPILIGRIKLPSEKMEIIWKILSVLGALLITIFSRALLLSIN